MIRFRALPIAAVAAVSLIAATPGTASALTYNLSYFQCRVFQATYAKDYNVRSSCILGSNGKYAIVLWNAP